MYMLFNNNYVTDYVNFLLMSIWIGYSLRLKGLFNLRLFYNFDSLCLLNNMIIEIVCLLCIYISPSFIIPVSWIGRFVHKKEIRRFITGICQYTLSKLFPIQYIGITPYRNFEFFLHLCRYSLCHNLEIPRKNNSVALLRLRSSFMN